MTPVSDSDLEEVCKLGSGSEVCRYLVHGPDGFSCAKHDEDLRMTIDAKKSDMVAQGDNCEGLK